jgi:hypothetical protein
MVDRLLARLFWNELDALDYWLTQVNGCGWQTPCATASRKPALISGGNAIRRSRFSRGLR